MVHWILFLSFVTYFNSCTTLGGADELASHQVEVGGGGVWGRNTPSCFMIQKLGYDPPALIGQLARMQTYSS